MIRKEKRSSAANRDGSGQLGSVFGRPPFATRAASPGAAGTAAPKAAGTLLAIALALAVVFAAWLALTASPALAVTKYEEVPFAAPLNDPKAIALDQSTHDIYVAEVGEHRVDKFGPTGNFLLAFGADVGGPGVNVCTKPALSECSPGTQTTAPGGFDFNEYADGFIAIDNTPGGNGDVYVATDFPEYVEGEEGEIYVSKYNSSGNLITSWGTGGRLDGFTTPAGPIQQLSGIAVDPSGHLLVLAFNFNEENGTVIKFAQDGTSPESFQSPRYSESTGLAVNAAGNLFKENGNDTIEEFNSSEDIGPVTPEELNENEPFYLGGFAVDPASGDLYAAQIYPNQAVFRWSFNGEGKVLEPAPEPLCTVAVGGSGCKPTASLFTVAEGRQYQALAVDSASGDLYADGGYSFETRPVYHYVKQITPAATTGEATAITTTSVTLNGDVNPGGAAVTVCQFEYGESEAYGESEVCAESPASLGSGETDEPVEADLTGLTPDTTYHFRLSASSAQGTEHGHDRTFETTGPPTVTLQPADHQAATTATLHAYVNPHAFPTTYHFQYGTSSSYGSSTPQSASIGSDRTYHTVAAAISGLAPATEYHFRVLAESECEPSNPGHPCVTEGPDDTFTTEPATCPNEALRGEDNSLALPECRAYERVSPADKGSYGAFAPVISPDGNRVNYESVGIYAGTLNVAGGYQAQRGNGGWSTQSLALPISYGRPGNNPVQTSTDLSMSVTSLVDLGTEGSGGEGLTALSGTFYLRRPDGTFAPATPPLSRIDGFPIKGDVQRPENASADLSHLTLESESALIPSDTIPSVPPDSNGEGDKTRLYEVVGATTPTPELRLVNLDSAGNIIRPCQGPGPSMGFAEGPRRTKHGENAISSDGGTIFFSALSPDLPGACTNPGGGPAITNLLARIHGNDPTQQTVDMSQPSPSECGSGPAKEEEECRNAPLALAEFGDAAETGSKAFFLSRQKLTDSASEDPKTQDECYYGFSEGPNGCNLYMYDFNRPAGENLTALSAGDTSGLGPQVYGVITASPDGSHVYFNAGSVLTSRPNAFGQAAQPGAQNLYVADTVDHTVSFIGELCSEQEKSGALAHYAQCPGTGSDFINGHVFVEFENTPDSRYLLFRTFAQLTPDDTNAGADLYRYDTRTGAIVRISVGHDGEDENGNGGGQNAFFAASFEDLGIRHVISADGQTIVFKTARPLQAGAPSERLNTYMWHQGKVTLLAPGSALNFFQGVTISASGRDIVFDTPAGLLPTDTEGLRDIYDARIGGGFPIPPLPEPPCESPETCHGAGTHEPTPPILGSEVNSHPTEAPAISKNPCKKGFVKKHRRCVKKHRRHHRHQRRAAARRRDGAPNSGSSRRSKAEAVMATKPGGAR